MASCVLSFVRDFLSREEDRWREEERRRSRSRERLRRRRPRRSEELDDDVEDELVEELLLEESLSLSCRERERRLLLRRLLPLWRSRPRRRVGDDGGGGAMGTDPATPQGAQGDCCCWDHAAGV